MTKLAPNFTQEEFSCHCGCGFMDINRDLIQRLQVIRDIVHLPMIILSGCRCKDYNTKIKGAKESQHILGNATDFRFEDHPMQHLAIMLTEWSGGFHFYKEQNFIHLDVGSRRRW